MMAATGVGIVAIGADAGNRAKGQNHLAQDEWMTYLSPHERLTIRNARLAKRPRPWCGRA